MGPALTWKVLDSAAPSRGVGGQGLLVAPQPRLGGAVVADWEGADGRGERGRDVEPAGAYRQASSAQIGGAPTHLPAGALAPCHMGARAACQGFCPYNQAGSRA